MQYDGLDQTGKTLVTPLLSSQGRVMVGKCDEIGGPYLQVMSETLTDGVETAPIAISQPLKTFTGGIASNDVQDNRNLIFKIILDHLKVRSSILPHNISFKLSQKIKAGQIFRTTFSYPITQSLTFIETRARTLKTYFAETLSAAQLYTISLSRSFLEIAKYLETSYKEYAQTFLEYLRAADNAITKTISVVRVEFLNIVLRTPKYLSGITEQGKVGLLNAITETGRMITALTEEGRASFSSIINYTPGDFYILVTKTFSSKVNTSISQGQTTLSAAPYINSIKVTQQHPIKRIWLTAYTAIIGFTETVGALNIIKYISERLKTLERHATSLPYNIKETMLFIDSKRRFIWSDLSESTYFAEARKINLLKGIRETLYTLEQQYKEFAQQFSHGIAVAEDTSRSILKRLVEFVNMNLPIIINVQTYLKEVVTSSHKRIVNISRIYQELAVSIDLRVAEISMSFREFIIQVDKKVVRATKFIKEYVISSDTPIIHNIAKKLSQGISIIENRTLSAIYTLIEYPIIQGIANSRFSVLINNGIAFADTTILNATKNIKEKLKLVEYKTTNSIYALLESINASEIYLLRSWIDIKENLSMVEARTTNILYSIKNNISTVVIQVSHAQPITFLYGISFSDSTKTLLSKFLLEPLHTLEVQLNRISKPLLQKLITRDHKYPEIQKIIKDIFTFTETHTRALSVKRVEFINIILSIPKRLSGITETGLVYLQNSITEVGDTVSTLSSNGRLTISYIVESTQSGFTKTVTRPISERLLTSHTIISRSMIHLLEETLLRFVVISSPLKRFVETIITSGSHLQQLLHVLKETTSMMYSRQSRVTSQLVHRLGIRDIEVLNTWRAFIHSISTSYGFLRRPQLILRERVASSHITSRIITSHIGEILRTLQIHSTSMFYNIKESISTIQSFRHRLAGLVTRPYTEVKSISKTTGARLSRNFATLKSYIKDSTASYEGDKK